MIARSSRGGAPGRRRLSTAPRRRRTSVAVVAVTVAASGLAGLAAVAGFTSAHPAASHPGTHSRGAQGVAALAAGGPAAGQKPGRATGRPDGGLSAAAAGPVPPSVMSAANRAAHFPRPATSSPAGRFNVGEPHSPQLLRELSGPPGTAGRTSPPGAPPESAAPSSTVPVRPAPGSTATTAPAPGSSATPSPGMTATAHTTALTVPRVTAAAPGALPQGIDVASFQHPKGAAINWAQVAGAGYKFAAVKGTDRVGGVDVLAVHERRHRSRHHRRHGCQLLQQRPGRPHVSGHRA